MAPVCRWATDLLRSDAPGGEDLRVSVDNRSHTRESLRMAAGGVAASLTALGLRPGDRVAFLTAGRMEVLEGFFGAAYAGGINAVVNPFLKGELLGYQLGLVEPRVVFVDECGRDALARVDGCLDRAAVVVGLDPMEGVDASWDELCRDPQAPTDPPVDPSDPVALIFTSGTTGQSKCCTISYRYLLQCGIRLAEHFPFDAGELFFTTYPLFHIGAYASLSHALMGGASIAIDSEFHVSTFWDRVRVLGATYAQATGAVGMLLLAQPESPRDRDHPLRRASWMPMAAEPQRAFGERFDVRVISEWYGQTEFSPISMNTAPGFRCQGSIGIPLPDVEVRVVDGHDEPVAPGTAGELQVRPRRSGIMFSGYWCQPERTVEAWHDLWYRTRDIVVEMPDGSLSFVDRSSDAVRRSGENVSSFEVEQVLHRIPGVVEAAVHAVPSDLVEDEIKAWIVTSGEIDVTAKDVFEFCVPRLPYFAIPRYVEFASDLPMNALGKVQKDALRSVGMTDRQVDLRQLGLVLERSARR